MCDSWGVRLPERVRLQAEEAAIAAWARDQRERVVSDTAADVAYAAGRADERARVVAWLRERTGGGHPAPAIERGEHLDGFGSD